ncbi:ABC transporter ATP-binding protein [Aquipuribacter hungaricus]|uniref:ABC transporter ATP-binding protein n=1 Tax=Aquipuribacter hungaricus TaxID=545624 RepID=A0ABV7WJ29_9MICO
MSTSAPLTSSAPPATSARPGPAGDVGATDGPVAQLEGVSRWYGKVVAVSDVTLTLRPGVTALLGPNGAGKSTLLRLVCGLTRPSRGTVRLLGEDPRRHPEVYRRVGLAPQQEALFDHESPTRFVETAARLVGLADPVGATREALDRVGLDPADPRPLRQRSGGERQRAKIAQAIVHRPPLLVLDEPVEGLDPRQRLAVLDLVAALGAEGHTVLVSSHVLGELDRISDRVLVMAQGRVVAAGTSHGLRELLDDRPMKVRVGTDRPRALAAALVGLDGVVAVTLEPPGDGPGAPPGAVVVDTLAAPLLRRSLAARAVDARAVLHEVRALDDDLDSVFRYLVTR